MLLSEFVRKGTALLTASDLGYPAPEAENMMRLLSCERLKVPSYACLLSPSPSIPEERLSGMEEDLSRLLRGEPLQYVLGKASFYGRDFRVGPGVLIPRPETEMLVECALDVARAGLSASGREPRPLRVLDLFTGSGCIPWTLMLECPGVEATAVDLSDKALEYARSQFAADGPSFVKADILCPPPSGLAEFDILTANPPYICESEKPEMRVNVLEHEPEMALLVPDADPLVFYRATSAWAKELLRDGGFAIVEINEKLGEKTAAVFSGDGFKNVSVLKDLSGRERFVSFTR